MENEIYIICNYEFYQAYDNIHSVSILKIKHLKWVGHIVRLGENNTVYKQLFGTPEEKYRRDTFKL